MKALMKIEEGAGNVAIIKTVEPEIQDANSVKIRVETAGICGTDLAIEEGKWWSNPPVILGHEFSGTVVEIGNNVKNIMIGDRVVSETAQVVCGHCFYCNTSNYLMCPERLSIGYGVDGAFANYIVVRDRLVHKIPPGISFDEAALCEPTAVAVRAVLGKVKLLPTDFVVVLGPGTIGLLCAQIAKRQGATVLVSGIDADEKRLEIASQLGIDYVINSQKRDLVAHVKELTDSMGCDVVYECSGAAPAITSGIASLKMQGTLIQVGLPHSTVPIEYSLLPAKEISLIGTYGHDWCAFETAMDMMGKRKIDVKPLISHCFKLDDWEEAFDAARNKAGMKVLFHPNK